mmetsp:Transcript_17663/g.26078  ORF Transcript_17663/g.26078 Transcript_17663/m.26078 type:complete len:247 (+) Transcript_17663:294-1034(+)
MLLLLQLLLLLPPRPITLVGRITTPRQQHPMRLILYLDLIPYPNFRLFHHHHLIKVVLRSPLHLRSHRLLIRSRVQFNLLRRIPLLQLLLQDSSSNSSIKEGTIREQVVQPHLPQACPSRMHPPTLPMPRRAEAALNNNYGKWEQNHPPSSHPPPRTYYTSPKTSTSVSNVVRFVTFVNNSVPTRLPNVSPNYGIYSKVRECTTSPTDTARLSVWSIMSRCCNGGVRSWMRSTRCCWRRLVGRGKW